MGVKLGLKRGIYIKNNKGERPFYGKFSFIILSK